MIALRAQLGDLAEAAAAIVERFEARGATSVLWDRDDRLFGSPPSECADRMGWLDAPEWAEAAWASLVDDAAAIRGGRADLVVMGMGGSSLFPEVLARTFSTDVRLHLLDTTHPHHLRRVAAAVPATDAVHVVSSKSGSTVETRSQLAAWRAHGLAADRLAVVTDPGSDLDRLAGDLGAAWTVYGDPTIGGRFSALSPFGMVPAALLGVDGTAVVEAALDQLDALDPEGFGDDHEAAWLAAAMAAGDARGRQQLTLLLDPRVASLGAWLEQLVAESLGKHGHGVVPVIDEDLDHVLATPAQRLVVAVGTVDGIDRVRASGMPLLELSLEDATDLGAQVVLWEVATALAGAAIGCNPFDQPDVESAKVAARSLLGSAGSAPAPGPESMGLDDVLGLVEPTDCVHVCAFVDPVGPYAAPLAAARLALGRRLDVATTFGIGPRFLHSSGQLHKGGPANQVVIQVFEPVSSDLAIPDAPFTFGELIAAQAAGDLDALRAAGRRAVRVDIDVLAALGS